MNITLARIDDRLIHGQVTTVWSKVANAQRIIICNDEVYNDEVRRTLLRQAAPPGMKVNVVNIEKAVAVYHNPQYQDETVFYLFTRPQDALAMVRQGVKIDTLNIGGMAWRPLSHIHNGRGRRLNRCRSRWWPDQLKKEGGGGG
uniref:PTS system mannose/fructose/N-acetylgalactosamine-transporter subunit IIB n=1 Tax=Escherichia coli TaxID=562 RepID=UPI001F4B4F0F